MSRFFLFFVCGPPRPFTLTPALDPSPGIWTVVAPTRKNLWGARSGERGLGWRGTTTSAGFGRGMRRGSGHWAAMGVSEGGGGWERRRGGQADPAHTR